MIDLEQARAAARRIMDLDARLRDEWIDDAAYTVAEALLSLPADDGSSRPWDLAVEMEKIRDAGWSVAVHNDYRIHGIRHTFWLFTHPDGRYVKGEGRSDETAIKNAFGDHHG